MKIRKLILNSCTTCLSLSVNCINTTERRLITLCRIPFSRNVGKHSIYAGTSDFVNVAFLYTFSLIMWTDVVHVCFQMRQYGSILFCGKGFQTPVSYQFSPAWIFVEFDMTKCTAARV